MENWKNLNVYLTKANENFKINEDFSKKLINFCIKNEKNEIKKILKLGASLNCHDEHMTPLIACIQNDNYELVVYLLNAGARISYKPILNFEDAFWFVLKNKKHNFLKLFVSKKCLLEWNLPKTEKESPQTALIYSTINSDLSAVEILLKHYAIKVNERDGLGNTALHYNVIKENMSQEDIDIGRLLIAAGADTNISNLDGKTPEDLAKGFTAKSMLLSGKLEEELTIKEESSIEEELDSIDRNVSKTKNKKIKI